MRFDQFPRLGVNAAVALANNRDLRVAALTVELESQFRGKQLLSMGVQNRFWILNSVYRLLFADFLASMQVRDGRFQYSDNCASGRFGLPQANSFNHCAMQVEGLFMSRAQMSR